ncbi:MAG TPA: hypothetical protein VFM82_07840 [Flavobacteriaceae bacterium]|nr:hypothetical protein [Flavobacteriaceae bacterium]
MRLIIQLVLWLVIGFLAYMTFNSIYEPIQFNKIKKERYAPVIERLKDIRDAEMAYKQVTGKFTGDFNRLIEFIDTAKYTIVQRRDSTVLNVERTKAFGVDMYSEITLIDTLGFVPVRDSLFGNSERYKNLMFVPGTNKSEKFSLEAGNVMKNESPIPVFEAKVAKAVLLKDQPKDLVHMENQMVSVDAINGEYIRVGSMEEVNTNGNWPTYYGNIKNE